ncbi:MAG: hypothetical protein NNA23_07850 [Nitrospira sp.]|nr:hypothetical protein [Nitrospira sp.]MCP9465557.1 hypothetical protein [Nitrospira sp.]
MEATPFSGHVIGLLKSYMTDLVQQAAQEQCAAKQFGFAPTPYSPHDALSDLLALLDDRLESEGIQVGLSEAFLHKMWSFCDAVASQLCERVWMEENIDDMPRPAEKAKVRELTYRALIEALEGLSSRREA